MEQKKYMCWITLNRNCNLRCKWCYAKGTEYSRDNDIKEEILSNIVNVLEGINVRAIALIGGEPTIHPNFLQILSKLKNQNYSVGVVTNGIKFSDMTFTQQCIDIGLNSVTLSLKAPNEKFYKEWTGANALKTVLNAMDNIRSIGMDLVVSVTINHDMVEHVEDIVKLLKESNVTKVYLDTERPVVQDNRVSFSYNCLKDTVPLYKKVYEAFKQSGIIYTLKISIPFCLFEQEFIQQLIDSKHIQTGCHLVLDSGIVFNSDGNLLLCNGICQNELGKYGIDFSSGEELLAYRNKNKDLYQVFRSYPSKKCIGCKHWSYCIGGCRIHWLYKNPLNECSMEGGVHNGCQRIN